MAVFIKKVFKKSESDKQAEKAKDKKKNQKKLAELLGEYTKNFTSDVDELYLKVDADGNGMLDKAECKNFLTELKKITIESRAANYKEENFEKLFDKFDDDKNGFMEKSELSVLIKQVFKQTKEDKKLDKAKEKPKNKEKLSKIMADYMVNVDGDIDAVWDKSDADNSGVLDKAECKVFMSELKKIIKPERSDNYDEANFEKLFEKFDDNGDGFMEKKEIAVFIKKVFKKTDAQKQKEKAATRPANLKPLSEYLGSYATDNITGNIDELWDASDADKNGMLDKEECKVFLAKVKEMMKEDRAKNYDEAKFEDIF